MGTVSSLAGCFLSVTASSEATVGAGTSISPDLVCVSFKPALSPAQIYTSPTLRLETESILGDPGSPGEPLFVACVLSGMFSIVS